MILLGFKYSLPLAIQSAADKELFPENWVELFFSLNNPIFYSILFVIITVAIFYVVVVRHSIPQIKRHRKEKEEIENRNNRLLALFAHLDPDPVLRFNKEGKIILANNAGLNILGKVEGNPLFDVISLDKQFDIPQLINKNKEINTDMIYGGKTYSLVIKGVKELDIGQVYFTDITVRVKYEEELRNSKEKLGELTRHLQNILEEERGRISKELHDGIGQMLAYAKLKLDPLRNGKIMSMLDNMQLYENLNTILTEAVNELKKISYNLKPRMLEDLGLIQSLGLLVREVSQESLIEGTFEPNGFNERLNPDLEINIYRICQELISNIVRHAKAEHFYLQLMKEDSTLRIMIDDDGTGFNPISINKYKGMGLYNINERVDAYGGKMDIDSSPGRGTVVMVEFPI